MRRLVLAASILALVVAVVGVGVYTMPVSLHTHPGGCFLTGLQGVLHGDRWSEPHVWIDASDDRPDWNHVEVIFPDGYSARFIPTLELLDPVGNVVAREGESLQLVGAEGRRDGQWVWNACGPSPTN